jgi:LysM repeat protein
MAAKKTFQLIVIVTILATTLVAPGGALAGGNCASYITVQWGDTLSGIAALCGTTAEAIRAANPGLGWWLYAGQVLYIPTGYAPTYYSQAGGTYVVQWGDTLGKIALRMGLSLNELLAVNPQIWNINLIYPGQVINLPANAGGTSPSYYPPPANVPAPASVVTVTPVAPVSSTPAVALATVVAQPTANVTATFTPTPTDTAPQYSVLRIIYGNGLLVRTGPGKEYKIIDSEFVESSYGTSWWYRKDSITVDSKGFVWAEITLSSQLKEYKTGWIMVKDPAGQYFTTPNLDPR